MELFVVFVQLFREYRSFCGRNSTRYSGRSYPILPYIVVVAARMLSVFPEKQDNFPHPLAVRDTV
jgi:hypothetical protein